MPRQSHVCRLDRNGQPVCHPVQRVDAINTFRVFAGRHTLFVQNERYQDPVIIERLVRAARRGVKVHIMARAPHHLKANKLLEGVNGQRILDDVGIKIHRLKHLKLHAKMISPTTNGPSSVRSTCRRAASTTAANWRSRQRDHHLLKRLNETAHHQMGAGTGHRSSAGASRLELYPQPHPLP